LDLRDTSVAATKESMGYERYEENKRLNDSQIGLRKAISQFGR